MKTIEKGKLHKKIIQIDGNEIIHTIWHVKHGQKAAASLFSSTCVLLQGNKLCSDVKNNIVLDTVNSNMCCIADLRSEMAG